jgi:hypothetical protein
MLINDYSNLDLESYSSPSPRITLAEILTAGIIFVLPVIFLLVISAN